VINKDIKLAYYDLVYDKEKIKVIGFQDKVFIKTRQAQVRSKQAKPRNFELLTAEAKNSKKFNYKKKQAETDLKLK